MGDSWAAGRAYEDFMGRWSRGLAARFVAWLSVPTDRHWLDVGCGTGALATAIAAAARPASVVACDPAAPLLDYARQHHDDARVSFVQASVEGLPTRPGGFDVVVSLLALNFFPEPDRAAQELRRVTAPGGTVAACVWDYAGRMELLRRFWDVVAELDPAASHLDEGRRFPLCQPEALASLFVRSGLVDVVTDALELPLRFEGFADLWGPFLGGTGPAPAYVATLDPAHRHALATRFERALPRDDDGTIPLVARAWVVRGTAG